jgi:hypothetical protein
MKTRIGALALCFAMTGCFHYKYTTTAKGGPNAPEEMHLGFVFGLIESAPVEIGKSCPGGFAAVDSQVSVVDGLIMYITGRLVDPDQIVVTCVEGSQPGAAK